MQKLSFCNININYYLISHIEDIVYTNKKVHLNKSLSICDFWFLTTATFDFYEYVQPVNTMFQSEHLITLFELQLLSGFFPSNFLDRLAKTESDSYEE